MRFLDFLVFWISLFFSVVLGLFCIMSFLDLLVSRIRDRMLCVVVLGFFGLSDSCFSVVLGFFGLSDSCFGFLFSDLVSRIRVFCRSWFLFVSRIRDRMFCRSWIFWSLGFEIACFVCSRSWIF